MKSLLNNALSTIQVSNESKTTSIQSLRFVAITFVFLYHFCYSNGIRIGNIFSPMHLGVQLFFIISGYVITLTLSKAESLRKFLVRRFFRIYISLFLVVPVLTVIGLLFRSEKLYENISISNMVMSMAAVPPSVSSLIFNGDFAWISGVLGTITQELFFYLISSIVYFTLGSRRFLNVISGISVALYFSLHLKFLDGFLFYEQFKVLARDFGFSLWVYFAFGIFLFYRNGKSIGSRVLWTLSLIIFAISQNMIDLKNRSDFDLAFFYLAALLFIFCIAFFATSANANKSRVLNNRYSKFIGNISYEFYLVHEFVGLTLISYLTQNLDLQIYIFLLLILYVLCLGISLVIYSYWYEPVHGYFEKKFHLLKR